MRFHILTCASLLAVSLTINPASAQETPAIAAVELDGLCQRIFADNTLLTILGDPQIEKTADGCTLLEPVLSMGYKQKWQANRVDIRAAKLGDNAKDWPEWGEITVHNVRVWADIYPAARYLMKIQQKGFDLKFAYQWQKDNRLKISEVRMSGPHIGDFVVAADIELPVRPAMDRILERAFDDGQGPELTEVKIHEITMHLRDQGMIAYFLMPSVVGLIGFDSDPEPEIENARNMVLAFLAGTPETIINADSKQALSQFTKDFPLPTGLAEVRLVFDPPFDPFKINKNPLLALGEIQKNLKVTARYQHN